MKINAERLADTFVALCEIDSPSRKEGKVCKHLGNIFASLRPEAIFEDDSAGRTGSDCGNLLVRFSGALAAEPVFFNCHMDTVEPGLGVRVRREDGVFASVGETILGADDKAGVAILIEALRSIRDNGLPHAPVEFVFTTCEEIGLLGAKNLAYGKLRAQMGYALDSTGTERAVIGAPAANHIVAEINGLAAHAGLNPESGINAVQLLARAVASLRLGRLDEESTANIGLIAGGTATNIVPGRARAEGEVRSHSVEKLALYTKEMREAFQAVVAGWQDPLGKRGTRPGLDFVSSEEYPAMRLGEQDAVLRRLARAAQGLGREIRHSIAGGGSDANIFNDRGLQAVILGIGMTDVHSTDESIALADMIRTTELVVSLLTH